jgi:NAD-dependent deacetylase sirtuin 4
MPLLRVPYTDPLPLPTIIPSSAKTTSGAIAALLDFLAPSLSHSSVPLSSISSKLTTSAKGVRQNGKTLLLTGAGISVASGLADYRGVKGTYTLNKTYKPIYYNEFCENHEARKRYWARSFLGWTNLDRAKPNHAHKACGELGRLGVVGDVITQSTSSIIPTTYLTTLQHEVCNANANADTATKTSTPSTQPSTLTSPPSNSTATSAPSSASPAATNTRAAPSNPNSRA